MGINIHRLKSVAFVLFSALWAFIFIAFIHQVKLGGFRFLEINNELVPNGVFKAPRGCKAEVEYEFLDFHHDEFVIDTHKCPGPGETCALSYFNSGKIKGEITKGECAIAGMLKIPK